MIPIAQSASFASHLHVICIHARPLCIAAKDPWWKQGNFISTAATVAFRGRMCSNRRYTNRIRPSVW